MSGSLTLPETLSVNGRRFSVLRLLGHGKGGYSYLVEADGQRYVLKQIHHEPCSYYSFGDKLAAELRDYARLSALGIPMPRLLDTDKAQERILKEYIAGETVLALLLRGVPLAPYLAQVQAMCRILYANGLNIDYFPTNFVPQDGTLYYIDYECNAYDSKWDFANWGVRYWSRTPELERYLAEQETME